MPSELMERKETKSGKVWFGLQVTTLTPDIAKQLGVAKVEGVVIEGVETGSPAQEVGLKKRDVILEVNRQKINDENDYRNVMEKIKPGQGALFLINRGGSTFFVSLAGEQ